MRIVATLSTCLLALAQSLLAADSVTTPRPVPLTRPEMKQLLEDMKARKPRIPLPELTEDDKQQLGERADSYESRLRHHYMPESLRSGFGRGSGTSAGGSKAGGTTGERQRTRGRGEFSREPDPRMTLDYPFKTRLFWIVSRTNNCQYCLGHQEIKLAVAGMDDDEIAALDCDWSRFPAAEQAAFAFARKLTSEPHLLSDADIDRLRKDYTPLQILEMAFSVAGNNSINRWKEGVGVPQSQEGSSFSRSAGPAARPDRVLPIKTFLTPTSPKYQSTISSVALLGAKPLSAIGQPASFQRAALEPRAEVEKALDAARRRKPRLPVLDESEALAALGPDGPKSPLPQWVRLLANFPRDGKSRIIGLRAANDQGDLTPKLKAQVSWIVARQDRAWYAVGEARERLRKLNVPDDQIYALDGSWQTFTPGEQAAFNVARKLAATPVVLTDRDVDEALQATSPREIVQLVNYITGRAFFNRVTEAAGLPLDP